MTLPGQSTPRTFKQLPVTIIDSSALKRVQVQMKPFMKPLTVWEGEAYDLAGDYTQAQLEARILELLDENPVEVLLSLYVNIVNNNK